MLKDIKSSYFTQLVFAYIFEKQKLKLIKYNAKVYQFVFGYSVPFSYLYLFLVFMPTYLTKRAINWIANIRR